jgi:putative ABC transport system permease protein
MNFARFALKNLFAHRTRTILTLASMVVAVAVLFTLVSFNRGYEKALKTQLQGMGIHMMVVPVGCPYEAASLILKGGKIPNYLPADVLDQVNAISGIDVAAPTFMSGIVRPDEGRTDIYVGVDSATLRLKNWWKIEGRFPEKPNEVLLGSDVALIEQSRVGDQIYVPEKDATFDVVGILEPTGNEDDGMFYIPLQTAQALFTDSAIAGGATDRLTGISIRLRNPDDAPVIASQLGKIKGAEVITMGELLGTMMSLMGAAKSLLLSIVLIIIVISALGVLNTVLMSVFERTREIGVMRATGAAQAHIFGLVWLETLMLSLLGGIGGLGLALVGARLLEGIVKKLLPLAPKGSVVALEPGSFILIMAFVIGIAVVAGFYPALRAARAKPIEALRSE